MRNFIYGYAILLAWISFVNACADSDMAQIGFVLVSADEIEQGTWNIQGTRAMGLDRDHVARAECQVLDSTGVEIAGGIVNVEKTIAPGDQEVTLQSVPAGENRFARIRGLDEEGSVWECGATGPFDIKAGQQLMITIVIHQPRLQDPQCEQLCTSHQDCPADAYCPSLCARQLNAPECTEALCDTDFIGRSCSNSEDCAQSSCLFENTGWPGGYCSAACLDDMSCMGRALCLEYNGKKSCLKTCVTNDDCRTSEGYSCVENIPGKQVCLPQE